MLNSISSLKMAQGVYLDYNATTPLADEVVKSVSKSLIEDWANPSSKSKLGLQAHCAIELAREQVASMINSETSRGIVFTSGGTEVLICLSTISHVLCDDPVTVVTAILSSQDSLSR